MDVDFFSPANVCKYILRLNPWKSPGKDGIHLCVTKICANAFLEVLSAIFSSSLMLQASKLMERMKQFFHYKYLKFIRPTNKSLDSLATGMANLFYFRNDEIRMDKNDKINKKYEKKTQKSLHIETISVDTCGVNQVKNIKANISRRPFPNAIKSN
ncbi:hypothetical protein BpHYR1_048458 [Brachionus plicatilis]|uniref:RNA-directed DNA polymerase from mobile element jockey-like n=1 Tax=Brachionus plicatilis TaxID=10195 RepID=A0A3M7PLV0_BRAPC|nr:hypothetical protein BpHYR1_048458 [Brachionus plicatilis]